MDNNLKYKQAFLEGLLIDESVLEGNLEYNTVTEWDSIGHMSLVAELEEKFDIMMEMEDIIDFSSFKKGIETLKKYIPMFPLVGNTHALFLERINIISILHSLKRT